MSFRSVTKSIRTRLRNGRSSFLSTRRTFSAKKERGIRRMRLMSIIGCKVISDEEFRNCLLTGQTV